MPTLNRTGNKLLSNEIFHPSGVMAEGVKQREEASRSIVQRKQRFVGPLQRRLKQPDKRVYLSKAVLQVNERQASRPIYPKGVVQRRRPTRQSIEPMRDSLVLLL